MSTNDTKLLLFWQQQCRIGTRGYERQLQSYAATPGYSLTRGIGIKAMPPHLPNFRAKILFICCHGIKIPFNPKLSTYSLSYYGHPDESLTVTHSDFLHPGFVYLWLWHQKKFSPQYLYFFFSCPSVSPVIGSYRVLSFQRLISLVLTRIIKMLQRCLAAFESLPICFGSQRSGGHSLYRLYGTKSTEMGIFLNWDTWV